MDEKIGLICSGGGMSCSYSAGVLSALARHFRFEKPYTVIGGSGSAGSLAYYVSGQYDDITRAWSMLLSTKKFINKWRFWKIINIDYLVDQVFKKEVPLDFKSVASSDILLFISAVDYKTGNLKYFFNKELTDPEEIFEILRASKAMPIAFNKKVEVQGRKYCDSYISSDPDAHVIKAIETGVTKIIIIDNRNPRPVNETVFKLWFKTQSIDFRRNYYKHVARVNEYKVPKGLEIIKIEPSSKIEVSTFNATQALLAKTIQMGYDDAVKNEGLKRILG